MQHPVIPHGNAGPVWYACEALPAAPDTRRLVSKGPASAWEELPAAALLR